MDKESIIELQKIDCNCNDCKFMQRDTDKYKQSLDFHHKMQLDEFTREKERLNAIVDNFYRTNELEKGFGAEQELNKMKFQFNRNEALINFGNCQKFNKPVSFIPNICQLETQHCFQHRRN